MSETEPRERGLARRRQPAPGPHRRRDPWRLGRSLGRARHRRRGSAGVAPRAGDVPRRRRAAARPRRPCRAASRCDLHPAPPGGGAAPDRDGHREQARPGADPGGGRRSRPGPLRWRPRGGLPAAAGRPCDRGGRARAVGGVPRGGPRLPGRIAARRGVRRASASLRDAVPRRPARERDAGPRSSRRATTRSARRRSSTGPSCSGSSSSTTTAPTPGPRRSWRRWPGSRPRPATAIKNAQNYEQMATCGRPPPVDPAARRSPGAADDRERDRDRDRQRARPAHRRTTTCASIASATTAGSCRSRCGGSSASSIDETPDQLRIRRRPGDHGLGRANRVAQNLSDAAHDPRAMTIPGTEDDLDESMLLAPLVFEERVLGVIVLSKLGLRQFTDDDLRLLVIYASLRRPGDRERGRDRATARRSPIASRAAARRPAGAPRVTASILGTLELPRDPRPRWRTASSPSCAGTTSRSSGSTPAAGCSRRSWPAASTPTSTSSRGSPAKRAWRTWVLAHGAPQLVLDELRDPRIRQFASTGDVEGSLICVPLLRPGWGPRRPVARAPRDRRTASTTTTSSSSSSSPPRSPSRSATPRPTGRWRSRPRPTT